MDEQDLTRLLLAWQERRDEPSLTAVVDARLPMIEKVAAGTLVHHRIHDPNAIDEVVSLVLDHLRRLPEATPPDLRVARFAPRDQNPAAAGIYLRWLTSRRAADVAASFRRRWRQIRSFTGLGFEDPDSALPESASPASAAEPALQQARVTDLHAAIVRLDLREQRLVQLLLDGRPQVAIARELGVSEAWVSRGKQRVIAKLRQLCDTDGHSSSAGV